MKIPPNADYPAIWAWGYMMGSNTQFIADEVAKARAEGAPRLATYKRSGYDTEGKYVEGEWATLDQVTSTSTQSYFAVRFPELYREVFASKEE